MSETPKKHRLSGNDSAKGKGFSSTNQPAPELKSAGWGKKKATKELLNLLLSGNDATSIEIRESLAQILGVEPDSLKAMTLEEVMDMKQIQRAIAGGRDWKALKEVVYGQKMIMEGAQKIVVTVKKKP